MKLPEQKIKSWKQLGGAVLDFMFTVATCVLVIYVLRQLVLVGGA